MIKVEENKLIKLGGLKALKVAFQVLVLVGCHFLINNLLNELIFL